ncbi:hypothetical protein PMAYCL1PPCAC_08944, partial [Pristionchus mayeri]
KAVINGKKEKITCTMVGYSTLNCSQSISYDAKSEEGETSSNDFVCDECQMAAIEFKKFVDDTNERATIHAFISENFCRQLPRFQDECDLVLAELLPKLWHHLDVLLDNPKQACAQIGFCPNQAGLPFNNAVSLYNVLISI